MSRNRIIGIAAAATVVSGVFFFTGAFAKFGQNDFMYATAPIFWGRLTLYQDLMFVQAPGSIFIYGAIYQLVDPADFFLILRVFGLFILLLALLLTYRTAHVLAGPLPAILALLFLCTSHFVASIGVDAGSTPLALLFLVGAIYIYIIRPVRLGGAAIIGLAIGLAASMKLNFAVYAVPFGMFIAFRSPRPSRDLLSYIVAGIIGSSLIWYYLLSDFPRFWFFNIRFHALMNMHREAAGQDLGRELIYGAVLFLLYAAPVFYAGIKASGKTNTSEERRRFLELLALLITSLFAAFAPAFYAPQYLATPNVLLSILLAFSISVLVRQCESVDKKLVRVLVGAAAIWILAFWFRIVPFSQQSFAWDDASPTQMERIRHRVDTIATSYLRGTSCTMKAVSLSPIPLVGTAFVIPPISSSGPFVPIVTEQIAKHSPEFSRYGLLRDKLAHLNATAYLVGYYPSVAAERLLVEHARENDFITFDVGTLPGTSRRRAPFDMQLLVRRSCLVKPVVS